MRIPECRQPWEAIAAVASGALDVIEAPAATVKAGRLLLREIGGRRCLEVEVAAVRIHTGARDRLLVRVVAPLHEEER